MPICCFRHTFVQLLDIWRAVNLQMGHISQKGKTMAQKTFSYEACGQILIIHLPREFDHHNCRNLKYETDLLLAENYINKIVFDFSRTQFMDSSGIGILINRYKQMAANGGKVALYGVNDRVQRILTIGGITRLIKHYATREEALIG